MKGDVFKHGTRVVLHRTGSDSEGMVGTVVECRGLGSECPIYVISLDDGSSAMTCACYADFLAPPKISKEWSAVTTWESCAWRPHLRDLPEAVHKKIRGLLALNKVRANMMARSSRKK